MLFNTIPRVKSYQSLHKTFKFNLLCLKGCSTSKLIEYGLHTGVAWLSSVRIVKSEVKSANGRNPCC